MPPRLASAVEVDAEPLRSVFLAMPGLCLTVDQATLVLGVGVEGSAAMLSALEDEGFLIRIAGGVYRRAAPSLA